MKRYLKQIFILFILSSSLFSCNIEKDKEQVNKVVENFYIYLNERNFDKIKEMSTPKADKYFEFILTIGDDLVKINKIDILETKIEERKAKVDVKVLDIYGNIIYCHWYLIKEQNIWKIDQLDGYKQENILTNEDIKYSKKDNPTKDTSKN